jgi:hypothetical protein
MNKSQLIGGILGVALLGGLSSAAFADRGYRDHDNHRAYERTYVIRDYDRGRRHGHRWGHRHHHRHWRDGYRVDRGYWYRPAPRIVEPGRLGFSIFYVD